MIFKGGGRDQRRSSRHPVPESRQRCEVKINEEVLPAWLVDESTGGFAVLVSNVGTGLINQKIELHTDGIFFDVRVAHVTEVIPRISVSGKGPWFRLGLRRLNEIEPVESAEHASLLKIAKRSFTVVRRWFTNHAFLTVATATLSIGLLVYWWTS